MRYAPRCASKIGRATLVLLLVGGCGVEDDERPAIGMLRLAARPDTPLAQWVGPACNVAARQSAIQYVIVHTCQGEFAGCVDWLKQCNPRGTSIHYVVSSTGKTVQLVEERDRAHHVGSPGNDRTIGIEFEGFVNNPGKWFTDAMYCAGARLIRSICERQNIPCDRQHVLGHDEHNARFYGTSSVDPAGGWDWARLMKYIGGTCGDEPAPKLEPTPPVEPTPAVEPVLALQATVGSGAADDCPAGDSEGLPDLRLGQTAEVLIDVRNESAVSAARVELALEIDAALAVSSWDILRLDREAAVASAVDAAQQAPRQAPGAAFALALHELATGETRRVRLQVAARAPTLGRGRHATVRARLGSGDVRAEVALDVIGPEGCGAGRDDDCDGVIANCGGRAPIADGCSVARAAELPAPLLLALALLALVGRRGRATRSAAGAATCGDWCSAGRRSRSPGSDRRAARGSGRSG